MGTEEFVLILAKEGEIRDGKTLVGLLMAQRALQAQDFPMASLSAPIQRFTGCASSREAK